MRDNIGNVLNQYRTGINSLDQPLLRSIISEQFKIRDIARDEYIRQVLTMTLLIDKLTYTNVRVENYKIFADVTITGTHIVKPRVSIPLYREQVPFLNGNTTIHTTFCFVYEQDELKIFSEDRQNIFAQALWGEAPPTITLQPVPTHVKPGSSLEISGSINKGQRNDVVFVVVNNTLVGSSAISGLEGDTFSLPVTVPTTATGLYELSVMAFAGTLDLNTPDDAILQGAQVIKYSIPVR